MNQNTTTERIDLVTYADMINTEISGEGLDLIKKIPEFFNKRLNEVVDFFSGAKENIEDVDNRKHNIYSKDLFKNKLAVEAVIGSVDYADIKRRKVPTIIGLNTDVLTLTETLMKSNELIGNNINVLLRDTSDMMAKIVSDPDFRLSTRPVVIDKKYSKIFDQLVKNNKSIINPRKMHDVVTVKEVLPSVPHLVKSIDLAIKYAKGGTSESFAETKRGIAQVHSYTAALLEEFRKDDNNIKKARVQEIAEYLTTTANLVTIATQVLYLNNQSVILLNNLSGIVTEK